MVIRNRSLLNRLYEERKMAYQYIWFCLVLMLHTILAKSCLDYSPNPCLAANHAELDDPSRSAAYTHPSGHTNNDYSLPPGWYRSVSPAAGDMPRTAPEMFYCKAKNPIWLNGPLPTEGAGIVMRTACARRYANVCHREYPTCIKNCGTFNVYYLQTALTPDDRYCFGTDSPCPDGQTSPNGFTPGCHDVCVDYDVLDVGDGSARSASHSREEDTLHCDAHRFAPEKYYRIVGENGADFVLHEGCVEKNYCSTMLPVWIKKDTHPKDQNMTELTACSTNNECCSDQWKVKVKLCYHDNGLGFYVYRLSGLDMCDLGYCVMPIKELPNRPTARPQTSTPTDGPIAVLRNSSTSTPTSKSRPGITSKSRTKSQITATEASEQIKSGTGNKETILITVVVVLVILMILVILGVLVYCLIHRASKVRADLTEKGPGPYAGLLPEENFYHSIPDGKLGTKPTSIQHEQLKQKEQTRHDKLGPVQDPVSDDGYMKPVSVRPTVTKPAALEIETVD